MTVNITDPNYASQWHFDLLGDIEAVWADYSGAGVQVAVYDDGMQTSHPDLNDNYDASLHFPGDNGINNGPFDGHGTSVGGLIAAELNGIGGVGVAWGASLTSVDYLNDVFFSDPIGVFTYAQNFDIVNASFGVTPSFDDQGGADFGDFNSWAYDEMVAMLDAVENGRGGLGTIMVKAVGNDANNASGLAQFGVLGNAQGESHNSLFFSVSVGAVGQDGFVENYSNFGHNLLVSAGAATHTTDLTGSAGYSSGAYTDDFGGTSAATPVTAGVIALMLEANPGLGFRDVQDILALSAAQTGSAFGGNASGFEAGEWQSMGGSTWNGGAMTFNPSYGYGLVDAFAAVRMAEVWLLMNETAATLDNQITSQVSSFPYSAINDLSSTQTTLTVTDGIMIDHAYVTIDLEHTYMSDLTIELITPEGDVVTLADGDGASNSFDGDWTFGVASLRGMSSEGDWTVRITDSASGDTGTFYSVTLEFFGSPESADDIWTFTDDFLDLADVEGGRNTIADTNGGTDWINMAAVAGDISVSLSGGMIQVNGANWSNVQNDGIEHIATGDGADDVTGSSMDNMVMAGRGDDLVIGMDGADTLIGSGGTDVLIGGERGLYGTEASDQVFRLYNAVFGRDPDAGGHQIWAQRLASGEMTFETIVSRFVASPEFQATYGSVSDDEFITLLYNNVLGRDPDAASFAVWQQRMANGMSREEVVERFSESTEHQLRTDADLVEFEAANDVTIFAPQIYRLYEAVFDREADIGGFMVWVDRFEAGMTLETAVSRFMDSAEFQATYGTVTDDEFITLLYNNVLGRDPDAASFAVWQQRMADGMSREEVVERFSESAEFVNNTADAMKAYMRGLGNDDVLRPEEGDSSLSGGALADTFVFDDEDDGNHVVADLEAWDYVDLTGFGYASEAAAMSNFSQSGDDVVFADQGVTITFADTALADITSDMVLI